ncbi:MAG TPA: NRAMP family divalent metal transporter [Flavisolibacter sp.]|jgi:Mn2+/Fe2+ NRAMP family transporter|nr:NRAMP family divalent metal transporter [Flavisolibacter sp.]
MANSSIGPGFLTQTSAFTQILTTSFGFVILVSVLLDIGGQLNTWRVLTLSELRAQDLSNKLFPGLGYFLSALVILGGFAFNIGNIAGCGLGINVLFGLSFEQGAIISCVIALIFFWLREIGKMLDTLTPFLGTIKILLTLVITFSAHPPLMQAVRHTFIPQKISAAAIVTIVGGTVGGYITFSGAHRLLDAGIKGRDNIKQINRSAISGILISTLMRYILFLAVLGVVANGVLLDKNNPAGTVFQSAAGQIGFRIFGIVLWSAAISSVMGAAYTSVSFFKTFHPLFTRYERLCISTFIVLSTIIFVWVGRPKQLLIFAGAINGIILPIALGIILIAATKTKLMNGYKHPLWMQLCGWVVVLIMSWMGYKTIVETFQNLFQ